MDLFYFFLSSSCSLTWSSPWLLSPCSCVSSISDLFTVTTLLATFRRREQSFSRRNLPFTTTTGLSSSTTTLSTPDIERKKSKNIYIETQRGNNNKKERRHFVPFVCLQHFFTSLIQPSQCLVNSSSTNLHHY